MKAIKFSDLWKSYPNESPCNKKNILKSMLYKSRRRTCQMRSKYNFFSSKNRHCWLHKEAEGHILSATDLATGLRTVKFLELAPH